MAVVAREFGLTPDGAEDVLAQPPEFFFDRSLGKETARELGEALGWVIRLASSAFVKRATSGRPGFWKVYDDGRVRRTWP